MPKRTLPILELVIGLAVLAWAVAAPARTYQNLRPGAALTYALDDAYIHMAMAKNLALHGVYGVTPAGFTSSSSSLLWTLALALIYRIFGVSDLAPLVLNLVCGGLALWAAGRLVSALVPGLPGARLAAMLAVIFLVPLPALILSGMETTLHVFLTLWFAGAAIEVFLRDTPGRWGGREGALLAAGLLFSAVRYESLALVALVCLLLALRRRLPLALALAGAALLPVLGYGLVSIANGWWFLPNSVLVKAYAPVEDWRDALDLLSDRGMALFEEPHLRVLLQAVTTGMLIEWRRHASAGDSSEVFGWLAALFLPGLAAQVFLGRLHWFYRYEAYLLALGIVAIVGLLGSWLQSIRPRRRLTWGLALLIVGALFFLAPLWTRAHKALQETPGAMTNIYDQQVQMARFLKTDYAGNCVLINDIGAISYQGDVCVIDLAGLATRETARAVLERRPLRPVFEALAREQHAPIAIVYWNWYRKDIPPAWVPVGAWKVERSVVLGGDTVTFYALHPAEVAPLRQRLIDFAPHLPRSVRASPPEPFP